MENAISVCHYSGVFMYFKNAVGYIIIFRAVRLKVLELQHSGVSSGLVCMRLMGVSVSLEFGTPIGTLSPCYHHDLGYHITGDLVPPRVPYHHVQGWQQRGGRGTVTPPIFL